MGVLAVDAQPLVAILLKEDRALRAMEVIRECRARGDVEICAVNLAEVLHIARMRAGTHVASRALALIDEVPITVVSADGTIATRAADLKARHGLGLGDSFAAALAMVTGSPLLTGDADFLPLAEHGLVIEWLGRPHPQVPPDVA
jgi:uncharacterized protein with PIN domain